MVLQSIKLVFVVKVRRGILFLLVLRIGCLGYVVAHPVPSMWLFCI